MNWASVFVPQHAIPEILLRGTLVYLGLFFALRFVLKRNAGQIGIPDLLLIVLLSEATQNAMGSELESVTEAAFLVGTVLFWNYALNWASFRFPALRFLTGAAPVILVENGRLNRRNMRREMITWDELMTQLREQGIDRIDQVKAVRMEGDGNFSVIRTDGDETQPGPATSQGA